MQKTIEGSFDLDILRDQPDLAATVADLFLQANRGEASLDFLTHGLSIALRAAMAEFACVAALEDGQWVVRAEFGPPHTLPRTLLAEAIDREMVVIDGTWIAAPLTSHAASGEVVLFSIAARHLAHPSPARLAALALALGAALETARAGEQQRRRIEHLEAILSIASHWNQTNEMEPLLVQMAEAATKLLKADRASIFLWDRPNHTLVGRPALGVKGGELRIRDDSGVVGQVVHDGQPRRIKAADQAQINRQVDRDTGYQTRNLLCVPLRGSGGELFGAFEVINRLAGDFSADDEAALVELAARAAIALENTQQFEQLLSRHRHIVEQAAEGVQLVGQSPAIEALESTIRRVADTELAILILGENGTGKEVVSQSIHYLSRRRDEPFIAVNCAAITETLLESELFGHEKGAFTDAHESRQGKFELASGGTLFLDEIGDLSLSGQAKLLRVLEEKVVVRVGGSKPIHTDARVIAATNQNLADMVRQKRFRQDLYFRLNVVTLDLPPLRERGDDVLLLAEHFLADFCRKAHRKPLKFSAASRPARGAFLARQHPRAAQLDGTAGLSFGQRTHRGRRVGLHSVPRRGSVAADSARRFAGPGHRYVPD